MIEDSQTSISLRIVLCQSVIFSLLFLAGCNKPSGTSGGAGGTTDGSAGGTTGGSQTSPTTDSKISTRPEPKRQATANPDDVKAARTRIDSLGSRASYAPKDGYLLTEIIIKDGSNLKSDDLTLFGKLSDLEKLQIFNCRTLNDEMTAPLFGLKGLKSLALTNSTISDATVENVGQSFPNLTELDLSSNTKMTSKVLKFISGLGELQRLTLVQNRIDDIGAQRLAKLKELKSLDLRGNMEAGDMALDVVSKLPNLSAFKHRSTAVTDSGIESLSHNENLESLLLQDFVITNDSGPFLAKLGKLSQLEIFRCPGFGSDGVLALKRMGLTRLTLRGLPNVDDRAMEVFDNLPKLRKLYLHELPSVSDDGLKHLSPLKSLELLDIWTVPQMKDATVNVIASLPNLTELSIRATSVTDACIDKLLKMPNLKSLTFKENGSVTTEGMKKLGTKKWTKLDIGTSAGAESSETSP